MFFRFGFFFFCGDDVVVLQEGLGDGLHDGVVLPDQGQGIVRDFFGALLLK